VVGVFEANEVGILIGILVGNEEGDFVGFIIGSNKGGTKQKSHVNEHASLTICSLFNVLQYTSSHLAFLIHV